MEALAADAAVQDDPLHGVELHGLAALIAEHREDQRLADRHLDALEGMHVDMRLVIHQSVWLLMARAARAERQGDPAGALAELRALSDPAAAEDFNQLPVWLPEAARLA